MSELASIFRETQNPAAAWLAFHLAKENNLPVPDIVAAEIDRFAAEVSKPLLAAWNGDQLAKITTKGITEAWGSGRGMKPAQDLRRSRRDGSIVAHYWDKTNEASANDAKAAVMKDYNLSDKSIEQLLTTARKTRDPDTPEF